MINKNSETTKAFYAFVQNKLHFAITRKTAAELIYERADSEKPSMGLTTWKDAPDGKILKRDIGIAKNYLNEKELTRLNRLVTWKGQNLLGKILMQVRAEILLLRD